MRRAVSLMLAVLFAFFATAPAGAACLPASLFAKADDAVPTGFDLAMLDGAPALCATSLAEAAPQLGCWRVDLATGALTDLAMRALPGHSARIMPDAGGCVDGFCVGPTTGDQLPLLVASSTDGGHTAVLNNSILHIFSTASKTLVHEIALMDEKAPDTTNVGLMPIRLLYVADTIFVVAAAAGPQTSVWAFRQDGRRLGYIYLPPATDTMFDVFWGGVSIVEPGRIALVDTGFQTLVLYSVETGAITTLRRAVSAPGCTRDHLQQMSLGDLSVPARCRRTMRARYEPYFDMSPVRLPSGDFLTTLTGPAAGFLAILDGKTLTEKRRIRLARCI